jgi:ABC-type branched-subunit amino acid transport system substrate-binding protein
MRIRRRVYAVVVVLGLVMVACGRSGSEADPGVDNGGTSATAACDGVTLKATDTGVTADTITIQVMADVGSSLAPGLFQSNIDAVKAYADKVNAEGGLACRKLVVETWDSKLAADEAKNGQIQACTSALAMVGGNTLFNPDVTEMNTCADAQGQPVGVPDVAALANDVNEQCSPNAFVIQAVPETCPIVPGQPRPLKAFVGQIAFYKTIEPNLRGLFLVPGDLPTTVQSATYQIAAQEQAGVDWIGAVKVSGRDEQSAYTPRVQAAKAGNATYVYDGSNDLAMMSMRRESAAQGLDGVSVWGCSIACYTQRFRQAASDVDGTYLWLQFLPFEEASTNAAAQAYVDSVPSPDAGGAQAWQASMLFRQVVDRIVQTDGPNAVTRARVLQELNATDDFTADGWMGSQPKPLKGVSDCFVVVQMVDGNFVRRFPEEAGTLSCDPANVTTVTLDPAAAAADIR